MRLRLPLPPLCVRGPVRLQTPRPVRAERGGQCGRPEILGEWGMGSPGEGGLPHTSPPASSKRGQVAKGEHTTVSNLVKTQR